MSLLSGIEVVGRLFTAGMLATVLVGCSDIYYDRRDSISLSAGDAMASNQIVHMVDPWPQHSANKKIAFNGQRMQSAIERYRQNKVTPPVNASTSSVQYQQSQQSPSTTTQSVS